MDTENPPVLLYTQEIALPGRSEQLTIDLSFECHEEFLSDSDDWSI